VLLGLLPAPIHYVFIPVGLGVLLSRYRPDGRPAYLFLAAVLRHATAAKELDRFAPTAAVGTEVRFIDSIWLVPDAGGPVYRPGRLRGPARVLLRYQARARAAGDVLELTQTSSEPRWRAKELVLSAGQTLAIQPLTDSLSEGRR
jgi:hypothetical protein